MKMIGRNFDQFFMREIIKKSSGIEEVGVF